MAKLKPSVARGPGHFTKFQRSDSENQEVAQSVRPQLPRDKTSHGRPVFNSGELPKGGFQSMWGFGKTPLNTKDSPTTKPGRKVY